MKVGIRKPNLKKSIKARTTGKVKRKLKKTVNPLYGKKGMGMIKNPKRAIKGKIYRATTVDPLKGLKTSSTHKTTRRAGNEKVYKSQFVSMVSGLRKTKMIWGIVLAAVGLIGLFGVGTIDSMKVVYIITCIILMGVGALLLFLYFKEKQNYELQLAEAAEQYEQEKHLEESKMQLEQAKVDAELNQLKADVDSVKVCPACGASTKGDVCEYCGSKL